MASNQGTLDDEDGDSSDWLELYNSSASPVDLDGWFLTDDPSNLQKWELPGVTLDAGQFLLIFASDKNRSDPAAELHTNFKLASSGEYLALVRPDGTTVEHHYSPGYPAQITDVSYGLGMSSTESVLLTLGAPLTWHVPTNGNDDVDDGNNPDPWIGNGFNDGGWTAGTAGAGYATAASDPYDAYIGTELQAELYNARTSAYLRIPFTLADPASVSSLTLKMRYDDGFVAYLNGQTEPVASAQAPAPAALSYASTATGDHPDADALNYVHFAIADPPLQVGSNLLAIHALNRSTGSSDLLAQPELVAHLTPTLDGGQNYSVNPTPGTANILGGTPGPLLSEVTETVAPIDVGGTPATVIADSASEFSGVQGQDGWSYGYHEGAGSYNPATDFTLFPGGTGSGSWSDSNHWDGGAWDFNPAGGGTGNPPWTEISATETHPNDSNPGPWHATVRRWTSDVAGAHTITGSFNNVSTSGDGTTGRIFHNGTEIFAAVTDGNNQVVNEAVTLAVGDTVDFYVDVGPADDDGSDSTSTSFQITQGGGGGSAINVPITAKVTETLHPLASVTLKYRIMFGAETDVAMVDDGTGDDDAAGDGTFTGTISTSALSAGQMLRWRVVASDTMGNSTVAPPYPDPVDSPEYFGTIGADPSTDSSLLPVMHWFVANPGAANNRSGTRSSLYFEGEFYDNILTDLHGQSTASFPKRSYDFDFNTGNRFRWMAGEGRVKDINLLTNWADKSKVRNTMGYALPRLTGEPCHFAKVVRVQQNGAFFSTADMVEDGDDRYLDRVGLDGDGALYKMYNTLNSTSGAAKKTRKEEDSSDLQALINGLGQSGDAKLRYGFDNVDIPGTVNYLACLTLINNRDHGHKNYYIYRDTEGTREWRPLIWDVDLNLGRNWVGGPAYFDDTFTVNGLINGASNRLKTLIYNNPDLWAMYLRRMKTLVDEIVQPAGTPDPIIETMVDEILASVDPAGVTSDADLDYTKWGSWGNNNNAAAAAARIKTEFMPAFRTHFFSTVAGTLPASQAAATSVDIGLGEFNPSSGNQDEEFFTLSHSHADAVDISGWRIDGGVRLDIPAGTVIPPGMTLYVGRDAVAFRGRATSPKADEKRFLISGYGGQLSARGETLTLYDSQNTLIDTFTYPGSPTDMQRWLRITELHYHPADPSAAELAINGDWTASDFEFVELTNIGPAPLDISGAQFVAGITFTFPASTSLGSGASVLVVANQAAFEARYGTAHTIAGEYSGQLDNGGEEIQLLDDVGENVVEFVYDDAWYPPSDGSGYSLQIRDETAAYDSWELAASWAPSCYLGGTPGSTVEPHGTTLGIWKEGYYSVAEAADPLVSGPGVDAELDSKSVLLEYSFNTNPLAADTDNLPTISVVNDGGNDYLAITYVRQRHATDLTYSAEVGDSPSGLGGATVMVGAPSDNGDGTETVTYRDTLPVSGLVRRFIRVTVGLSE